MSATSPSAAMTLPSWPVIRESRVDGIVLWTDEPKAAMILKQMRDMGMKQPVFGSHRTLGTDLVKLAGPAAEVFRRSIPITRTAPIQNGYSSRCVTKPSIIISPTISPPWRMTR
jgi:hypothetical protein